MRLLTGLVLLRERAVPELHSLLASDADPDVQPDGKTFVSAGVDGARALSCDMVGCVRLWKVGK